MHNSTLIQKFQQAKDNYKQFNRSLLLAPAAIILGLIATGAGANAQTTQPQQTNTQPAENTNTVQRPSNIGNADLTTYSNNNSTEQSDDTDNSANESQTTVNYDSQNVGDSNDQVPENQPVQPPTLYHFPKTYSPSLNMLPKDNHSDGYYDNSNNWHWNPNGTVNIYLYDKSNLVSKYIAPIGSPINYLPYEGQALSDSIPGHDGTNSTMADNDDQYVINGADEYIVDESDGGSNGTERPITINEDLDSYGGDTRINGQNGYWANDGQWYPYKKSARKPKVNGYYQFVHAIPNPAIVKPGTEDNGGQGNLWSWSHEYGHENGINGYYDNNGNWNWYKKIPNVTGIYNNKGQWVMAHPGVAEQTKNLDGIIDNIPSLGGYNDDELDGDLSLKVAPNKNGMAIAYPDGQWREKELSNLNTDNPLMGHDPGVNGLYDDKGNGILMLVAMNSL